MIRCSHSLGIVLLVCWLLNGAAFSQAPQTQVYVPPLVESATTCEDMTFNIMVNNVVDLTAFHLEINYTPGIVKVVNVENGEVLGSPTEPKLFEPTNWPEGAADGSILFGVAQQGTNGNPLPKDVDDDGGILITITLRALKTGNLVPFTINAANSMLVNWPDVELVPFIVTGPGVVATTSCAPTAITLAPGSVKEGLPAGTVVGTLTSTDADDPDSWTYSTVNSADYPDNLLFAISGDQLITRQSFVYSAAGTYTILVRSTDAGGSYFDQEITITVVEDGAPVFDPIVVPPVTAGGTLTFTVKATDPEGGPLTYSLGTNTPAGAAIDPTTGAFSWDTTGVLPGEYTFDVCVSDGLKTTCQPVTVTVGDPYPVKLYLPIIFR